MTSCALHGAPAPAKVPAPPAHFRLFAPALTTNAPSPTLTQRLARLWPYFRSAKTGIALAAVSTLIGALTERLDKVEHEAKPAANAEG